MAKGKKVTPIRPERPKRPSPKQLEIPGAKRTHYADIEAAADRCVDLHQEHIEARDADKAGHRRLLELMRKHKLETLRLADDRVVRVKPGEDKVKVEKPKRRGRRARL